MIIPDEIQSALHDLFHEENVDYQNSKCILINFPEFFIKNDLNQQHLCRNLLIKLEFSDGDFFNPDLSSDRFFTGLRTTITTLEFLSHYKHSHLQSGQEFEFAGFCCGETLLEIIQNFLIVRNIENFLMILHMLENFVKHESLIGGPYKCLSNMYSAQSLHEQLVELTAKNVMNKEICGVLQYSTTTDENNNTYYSCVGIRDLNKLVLAVPDEFLKSKIFCKELNLVINVEFDEYAVMSSFYNKSKADHRLETNLLFKGKEIQRKIICSEHKSYKLVEVENNFSFNTESISQIIQILNNYIENRQQNLLKIEK